MMKNIFISICIIAAIGWICVYTYINMNNITIAPFDFDSRMIYNKIDNNHNEIMNKLNDIEKLVKELKESK